MTSPAPTLLGRPFIKMHGLRNHFVIVDARSDPYRPGIDEIVRICDAQVGVGADQLVVMEPALASTADVFMRLYNVDGREVGACGNATRCVAWLLLEERSADCVKVETLAGVLECRRAGDRQVACAMGRLRTDWQSIPLTAAREPGRIDLAGLEGGFALNIGNPHLVFFVPDIDAIDLSKIAIRIQADALFPDSVNVGIAQQVAHNRLRLRVYERGAGLTMACGTGACAAAYAAYTQGLVNSLRISVALPGGDVLVELESRADEAVHAIMTGPVAFSFRGEVDAP
ncbi:MAG: diaminopimelate epimerase [Pseudomonadota bacterium]